MELSGVHVQIVSKYTSGHADNDHASIFWISRRFAHKCSRACRAKLVEFYRSIWLDIGSKFTLL